MSHVPADPRPSPRHSRSFAGTAWGGATRWTLGCFPLALALALALTHQPAKNNLHSQQHDEAAVQVQRAARDHLVSRCLWLTQADTYGRFWRRIRPLADLSLRDVSSHTPHIVLFWVVVTPKHGQTHARTHASSLSFILAIGFLLIILSGALYGNWMPLLVGECTPSPRQPRLCAVLWHPDASL